MMKCEAFDGVNVELLLAFGFWLLAASTEDVIAGNFLNVGFCQ